MYPDDIHRNRKQEEADEQLPAGSVPEEGKKSIAEERDADDLVHSNPIGTEKPDAEIDPDDAVHQGPPSPSAKPGMADPDDLVHGG